MQPSKVAHKYCYIACFNSIDMALFIFSNSIIPSVIRSRTKEISFSISRSVTVSAGISSNTLIRIVVLPFRIHPPFSFWKAFSVPVWTTGIIPQCILFASRKTGSLPEGPHLPGF